MIKKRFLKAGLALALVSVCSNARASTTPEERARIWAMARLVLQPGSAEGLSDIRTGLRDGNPAIRGAAARVARATRAVGAIEELRQALPTEPDDAAALETLTALADLDDTSASDDALAASVEAGDSAKRLFALVAARGRRVTAVWPRLKPLLEAFSWTVARGLKSGLHHSTANLFASYAIRDGMEDLYDALLFTPGLPIEASVVTAGLASQASGIRSSAYIAVADRDLPVAIQPPAFSQATLCERVSRHLFEAARGFAPTEPLNSLMTALSTDPKARKCVLARFSDAHDSVRGLKPDERGALLKEVGADKDVVDRAVKKIFDVGVAAPAPLGPAKSPPIRTIAGHSPEFVQSVLEGTKCKGRERSFDGVDITYAEGGRIQSALGLKSGSSAEGCGEAAKVLGLTSYANDGSVQVTKILPERPEFLACLTEVDPPRRPAEASPEGVRAGGNIKEPKKVKSVAPQYPTNASLGDASGLVILDASIRPSGCVGGLTILKSAHPILDLEAINAVSGWRYSPTFIDGAAIPVLMTITVNFRRN